MNINDVCLYVVGVVSQNADRIYLTVEWTTA